jgi:hypothetical protein
LARRLFYRRVQISGRDFSPRRNMPQIDADALDDAILQWVFVDRRAGFAEVPRRVDMGAAVVRHGKEHHAIALDVSRLGKGLVVGLPDAVDDRRLSRIGRRAMIEFPA